MQPYEEKDKDVNFAADEKVRYKKRNEAIHQKRKQDLITNILKRRVCSFVILSMFIMQITVSYVGKLSIGKYPWRRSQVIIENLAGKKYLKDIMV